MLGSLGHFSPWSLNYSMHRKTVSLNIKYGELTVASLMENSQSDSQELTGKTSLLDWWGCCQGFLFLIFDIFSLPTIQELQAQAVLFFSRKMNLFPWNRFVSEGSFWCCLPLSSCDARKLQQGRPSICKSETMGNEVVLRKLKRKIHARWGYLSI